MKRFILPIGFTHNGKDILEMPIAETGGEAEKIFTKKPSASNIYTWFGQVLSVAIESVGGDEVSSEYIKSEDKKKIPDVVKNIPFIDAGTLLIQVQRECWEDMISDQEVKCKNCGTKLKADIDLNRIEIPNEEVEERKPIEFFDVKLPMTYTIQKSVEQLDEFNGLKFNHIKFRVATLGDAIKHEMVSKDEVLFWRNIAFDTMVGLFYKNEKTGDVEEVPSRYITLRGKQFFTKDFNSKTLREIRKGLQVSLPSAKFFYEEECPECGENTPFFASVGNFFMV